MKFKHVFPELSSITGLLYSAERLVVPQVLRTKVMLLCHKGHIGIRATKRRLRDRFWWPGWNKDVDIYVRDCINCMNSDKSLVTVPSDVSCVPTPDKSWEKLAIDILGLVNLSGNIQVYGIVVIDFFSR